MGDIDMIWIRIIDIEWILDLDDPDIYLAQTTNSSSLTGGYYQRPSGSFQVGHVLLHQQAIGTFLTRLASRPLADAMGLTRFICKTYVKHILVGVLYTIEYYSNQYKLQYTD